MKEDIRKAEGLCDMGRYEDALSFLNKCPRSQEIETEVEKIQKEFEMAKQLVTDGTNEKFIKWCTGKGMVFNKAKIATLGDSYRGVFACEEIVPGDVIQKIPMDNFFKSVDAWKTPLGKELTSFKEEVNFAEDFAFISFYLHEKGNVDSLWKPYLNILPKDLSSFPAYFTPSALSCLKGTFLLGLIFYLYKSA